MTFEEWVRTMPAKTWVRHDLATARLAWEARSIPWRKVSEEPKRGMGAIFVYSSDAKFANPVRREENNGWGGFWPGDTHWCYLDELKPEDTE